MSNDERAKAQSDHDNPELQYDIQSASWHDFAITQNKDVTPAQY
jgi:hypothetical protein